jgi:hypothetical protein
MRMLTLGSVVLALVNVVVMWGMAHRWRYAWHGNLGLQLLWLPYDYVTRQYGLLGLGAVMTVVSIKGCLHKNEAQPATAVRSRSRHRRPRRGWFGRRTERAGPAGQAGEAKTLSPSPTLADSLAVAAASTPACVPYKPTTTSTSAMLARRLDRRRQSPVGLARRRKPTIHQDYGL